MAGEGPWWKSWGLASPIFLKLKVPAARVFCSCGPVLYWAFCCQTMRSSASRNCSRILLRSHHLVTFSTPSTFVSRTPKSKRPNYFDYTNDMKRIIVAELKNQDVQQAVFGFIAHGTNADWCRLSTSEVVFHLGIFSLTRETASYYEVEFTSYLIYRVCLDTIILLLHLGIIAGHRGDYFWCVNLDCLSHVIFQRYDGSRASC